MKIKDGFITKDDDGTIKFHKERPTCHETFWTSSGYVFINLDIFDGFSMEDGDIKQIYNGQLINPLPDLKEGEMIEVLTAADKWVKRPFSCFDEYGCVWVYHETRIATSWRYPEDKSA